MTGIRVGFGVGAPNRNMGGAAYVFTLRHGTWSRTGELTASDAAQHDLFGSSVALSALGSTALVGAPNRHSGAGAVYAFTEGAHVAPLPIVNPHPPDKPREESRCEITGLRSWPPLRR